VPQPPDTGGAEARIAFETAIIGEILADFKRPEGWSAALLDVYSGLRAAFAPAIRPKTAPAISPEPPG
jgi:hypothetical protein